MYRETPPPAGLADVVACLWTRIGTGEPTRIVPDGCADLLLIGGELTVAGADTGPRTVTLPAGVECFGVRLRPGAAGAVLGMPASEVVDLQVELAGDPLELVRGTEPDRLVAAAARRLGRPRATVASVATDLGVTERTLHRRTVAAVGYGPKLLARVARLRRLMAADGPLAARALDAGYASQSHMADEVRRLTGTTAVRFLEDARLTAA